MKNIKYDTDSVEIECSIHETSEPKINISNGRIEIEFYDIENRRIKILFIGFLGFRQTKKDCYDCNQLPYSFMKCYLKRVTNSDWIKEIKFNMNANNKTIQWEHLGEPQHYIVWLDDDIIEFIAYKEFEIIKTDIVCNPIKYTYPIN